MKKLTVRQRFQSATRIRIHLESTHRELSKTVMAGTPAMLAIQDMIAGITQIEADYRTWCYTGSPASVPAHPEPLFADSNPSISRNNTIDGDISR